MKKPKQSSSVTSNILLIDCHSIAYMVFHAMGELGYHGRKTGVAYGFLNQVLALAKKFETNRFVFCWDSRKSLRKLVYPKYKDRPKDNTKELDTGEVLDKEAFYEQLNELRSKWLPQLGFNNNFRYAGLEADDVIALVLRNSKMPKNWPKNPNWIIVSTDRDLYQLLAHNVSVWANKKVFTCKDFKLRYGIDPKDWIKAKALGGCNSDTVEGIKGIADPAKSVVSRALRYLNGYLKGTLLERIESPEGREIYKRNLKLVSLPYVTHITPKLTCDEFRLDNFVDMFDELDFRSFLKQDTLEEWKLHFDLN